MGLQHAVPIKETEKGFNEHLYFASSSMQGYRPEQEDAHLNAPDVTIDPSKNFFDRDHKFAVFGVFDGHAGAMASDYCSKHLLSCVVQEEEDRLSKLINDDSNTNTNTNNSNTTTNPNSNNTNNDDDETNNVESQTTNSTTTHTTTTTTTTGNSDASIDNNNNNNNHNNSNSNADEPLRLLPLERRVWGSDTLFAHAYLKCDANLKQYHLDSGVQPELGAGTTNINVFCRLPLDRTRPHEVICTNIGDSRAILYDGRTGETVALSKDQKPSNEKEKARIEAAGKVVSMGRVMGNLAVARAFGDFRYKNSALVSEIEQAVCVDPEIKRYEFIPSSTPTNGKYQFVVLACDGLWDKMQNTEVNDFIVQHFNEYKIFDEEYALTKVQMEPVQRTWMHKQVSTWNNDDIASYFESKPSKFKRYFRLITSGRDLANLVTNDVAWNHLVQTKEGLANPHDFTEAIGKEFRAMVLETIEEINTRLTSDVQIKSTVDKLAFLTERLIDYVVFKRRSEDNVSVTIILLRPHED